MNNPARSYLVSDYKPEQRYAVVALWHANFSLSTAEIFERDIDQAVNLRENFFVTAVLGDELVGTSLGAYDGYRGWIYYLCVKIGHRRRGLGAKMLADTERRLYLAGCQQIGLHVRKKSGIGLTEFYRVVGYQAEAVECMGRRS